LGGNSTGPSFASLPNPPANCLAALANSRGILRQSHLAGVLAREAEEAHGPRSDR
jgi:hypothetical protein